MLDRLDMRTLGGLRLRDHVTGAPLDRVAVPRSRDLRFARTLSGVWQVRAAPGFAAYARAVDPVPAVAQSDVAFTVEDATGQFLPVAGTLSLPRDAAPDAVANRVDTPVEVALPSAPGRRVPGTWSAIRVSVVDAGGDGLSGALIVATDTARGAEIGWTLSDRRGEALLPLAGIALLRVVVPGPGDPPPDPADPPALTSAVTPVALSVTMDPAAPWPADPVRLRAGGPGYLSAATLTDIPLTARAQTHLRLTVPGPP